MILVRRESSWRALEMNKPQLEIIEKDDSHIIYYLYQDLSGLDLYTKSKAIDRFVRNEPKVMERVLEGDLKNFLRVESIIPQTMTESALNECFYELKKKGKEIVVIDRYANAYDENIIAVSENEMTVILDKENIISISIEIRKDKIC